MNFTFEIVYKAKIMEFQESEAQNESETVSEDAQNVSDKQKRGTKKPFRGSKQIYTKIMDQLEFYFSPSNLTKDRFMAKLIQEDPCKFNFDPCKKIL